MYNKKVRRMPYSKTYRQDKRLEMEEAEKMLKAGRRKNQLIFVGFVIGILALSASILYLTTLIPDVVYSLMGVDK